MKSSKLMMMLLLFVSALNMGEASAAGGHRHGHGYRHFEGSRHAHAQPHFHRHRHRHGPIIHFGFSAGPAWGPYPRYYTPVVVERVPAPVYIERQPEEMPAASSARTSYWYYCNASRGYYPYVRECPGGWQRVPPRPADEPRTAEERS